MANTNHSTFDNINANEKDYEVRWDEPQDPQDPKNITNGKKWLIVLIVSLCAFCLTASSTIYASTYSQITEEFRCSEEVATLGLSLFVLGLGLGPMLLAPLSEFYGRRIIYIGSLSASLIWTIPCAVAQNIQTLIVVRFLAGFAGSAFLAVGGGTVVDLFSRNELQLPMTVYSCVQLLGPVVGPIIGGFIVQYTTWRWCFYVFLIWIGVLLGLVVIFVPETLGKVVLRNKARRLRASTGDDRWYAPIEKSDRSIPRTVLLSCYRPFQILAFEPMCQCLDLYSALVLGIVYLFFGAFGVVFRELYHFNSWQVGLSFLGLGCGIGLGALSDPVWRRNRQRLVRQAHAKDGGEVPAGGSAEPEFRLPPTLMGSILICIGLFWFAWTTYSSVHWIVPIIGTAFFGAGTFLAFTGMFTFLADAYGSYAASALAGNVFVRCVFAAAFPLFGNQMYRKLGPQWATSLLGFLTLAMLPFPFIFYRYGKRLRARSRFAAS